MKTNEKAFSVNEKELFELSNKLASVIYSNKQNPYLPFAFAVALGYVLRGTNDEMFSVVMQTVVDMANSNQHLAPVYYNA